MRSDGRRAEDLVAGWLRSRGLLPERFPPRRRRLTKTPDFRVVTPTGEAFFLEVKTLTRAEPGYGAVFLKLMRARAQFDAVNQGGHLANVLALVAAAPQRLAPMLADVAPMPSGPLREVDLVLGFTSPEGEVSVLHEAPAPRHRSLLARVAPPAAAASLTGDQR